jgi:hypothetical protein
LKFPNLVAEFEVHNFRSRRRALAGIFNTACARR